MKKIISILLLFIIAVAVWSGIAFGVYITFLKPNNEVVPAFSENEYNIIIEDNFIYDIREPIIINESVLLPLQSIKEYFDPDIYWDAGLHKLTITTKDRVVRMETDGYEAFINNKPVSLRTPLKEENGKVYVPAEFLCEIYGFKIEYKPVNNAIIIDYVNRIREIARPVVEGGIIRRGPSRTEPILKKISEIGEEETELRIYEEYDKWYKVRDQDGIIGYIEKKYLAKRIDQTSIPQSADEISCVWTPADGKINMAWDYAYNAKFNPAKKNAIEGLDVISPTWFQVTGKEGEIKDHADIEYVKWAHENDYKVWALFSNSFGDSGATGEFLNNTDSRDNAIRNLLILADKYNIDGINIDFEDIRESDRDALTQFVRELSPLLREQGYTVSVDLNLLPCYDRKALGEAVDYVALMAYDQHWKGGGVAGSVSQVSWTERVVELYLKDVPAEKVILGMPFYTRLWKETDKNGTIELTSQALSMEVVEDFLKKNKAEKNWDSESGQFYSELIKDGATYKVWLEDENSLNLRTSLVHKYSLAGAAAWRLNFEEPEVWNVINRNLKALGSYSEWLLQNKDGIYAYN